MSDGQDELQPRTASAVPGRGDFQMARVVGDRYRVERQIGAGAMAAVFLAEDLRHNRKVAIKVLQETLTHTIGIQRFLQEIDVIARLQHPHLLTLIDSGDVDGLPYYVMPFIEAQSLRDVLRAGKPLSIERAVAIAREVADGLAYAHRNGIVHRDIKPSNILMSGGHAVVADFGIATALQKAAFGRLTESSISLGSPTYASPEQASGERDLDARTDMYSLACVLYEMLCGEPPIDKVSVQLMVTRKLTGTITKLRERRADVPPALEDAIHRALATERNARFTSMEDFAYAIAEAIRVPSRGSRRTIWIGTAALIAVLAVAAAGMRQQRRVVWATQQVSAIGRLAAGAEFAAAFDLTERILPIIPRDSTLRRLRPSFTDFLEIVTLPAGARVYRQRLDDAQAPWDLIGTTPLDSVPMPRNGRDRSYRLRFERAGYETAELLPNLFSDWSAHRGVAALDTLRLDRIGEAPGMVRIPGWSLPDPLHSGATIILADYHIGKHEVTNQEFMAFVTAGGYRNREYWTEPFLRDGATLSWEQAMAEFRDLTGLPGPSTWRNAIFPAGQEDFPVGGVSYYEAAAYARFAGKRLPTAAHWSRAALRHAVETSWIYMPASNLDAAQPRRVGQGIMNSYGLYDIAGNVREWCVNRVDSGRLTRGGSWEDAGFFVGHLIARPEFDRSPGNGFRLVALSDADTTIARLSGTINRAIPRDYNTVTAVSDAEFAIYRRLFDYDPLPLQESRDTGGAGELYRWERVSFTAAYGAERMAAYILLPLEPAPPYEAVVMWPPGAAITFRRPFDPLDRQVETAVGFIPRSGRALVIPVFKGSFERDAIALGTGTTNPDSSISYRDLVVQWVKDVRRTIDYVETRPDMKTDRIGFYGWSWGGEKAPLALAVEPRITAAVLNVGGYVPNSARPEVDAPNYVPRVRTPTLMLNGRHDVLYPYETSQVPFFRQLGTPERDKQHITFPASHFIPQDALARETLAWFDRYLSGALPEPLR